MAKGFKMIMPPSTEKPQNILHSKVEEAKRTLKRNKSQGSDGITIEMIQAGRKQQVRKFSGYAIKPGAKVLFQKNGAGVS